MGTHSTRQRRAQVREHMQQDGTNDTTARRALEQQRTSSATAGETSPKLLQPPVDTEFGGHEFDLDPTADLFRCWMCERYEVTLRAADGTIAPCTGLAGYGDDPERVYLLLTLNQALPDWAVSVVTRRIGDTGIGRTPSYSILPGTRQRLVESAPSVVDDLRHRIQQLDLEGKPVPIHRANTSPAVEAVTVLTADEGQRIIAENYTAYVAEHGEPRSLRGR